MPTGHPALDARLPGAGWPRRALTELSSPTTAGVDALRLLAPVLAAALQAGRPVMLFDPPPRLSAWALAQVGLDAAQLLVIDGRNPALPGASSLWALEQALKSGHVGAALAWLPPRLCAERLHRLQQAARQHDGPAFVIRERAACSRPTAAPLRLALQADGADRLLLRLPARRGLAPDDVLRLALPPLLRPAKALAAVRRVASSKVCGMPGPASRGSGTDAAGVGAGNARRAALHAPLHGAVFVDLGG